MGAGEHAAAEPLSHPTAWGRPNQSQAHPTQLGSDQGGTVCSSHPAPTTACPRARAELSRSPVSGCADGRWGRRPVLGQPHEAHSLLRLCSPEAPRKGCRGAQDPTITEEAWPPGGPSRAGGDGSCTRLPARVGRWGLGEVPQAESPPAPLLAESLRPGTQPHRPATACPQRSGKCTLCYFQRWKRPQQSLA